MDLGWIDKTAIIDSLYDRENRIIYVVSEFYKSGAQLNEVVAQAQALKLNHTKVYVDSAEPRSIAYFKSEGINAVGCKKGKDSVKNGLKLARLLRVQRKTKRP